MTDPYQFARSLARPIARRILSRQAVIPALTNAIDRDMRRGTAQGEGDLQWRLNFCLFLLDQEAEKLTTERDIVEHRIKRTIAPLIAQAAPANRILAEAHDVNGSAGFAFFEHEVKAIVATELHWAMQRRSQNVRGR